ncbi:transcriptional regulator, partial [Rhizobium leguminosarum]
MNHPVKGRMSFEHNGLTLTSRPEMKLIVYTPIDDDDTNRKL